jgi:HK97 family phage portal protein
MGVKEWAIKKLGGELVVPTKDELEFVEKSSRTVGIGDEFTYAQASQVLAGSMGIPQPRKLYTYSGYVKMYGQSVWVYACVYQIAVSIAGIPMSLYKKPTTKEGRPMRIDSHPILHLIRHPNPWMSGFDLKEACVASMELTGNAYQEKVYEAGSDLNSVPIELYPLQAHRIKIIPDMTNRIAGYKYSAAGRSVTFVEEEIIHTRYYNPESDFYGCPALSAGEMAINTDMRASKWNKSFFDNSARPDAILETEQQLSDTLINRLKKQWRLFHQGTSKAHDIAVLEGGLKYKQVSLSQKEMDFIQSKQMSRDEILAVFGVPPAILGLMEKANFANMESQRRNFWENTLLPKVEKLQAGWQSGIVDLVDDRLRLVFDLNKVEALKESRESRAKIGSMLVDRGLMTQNEARAEFFDLPPVDWGNTWYMPLNITPVDKASSLTVGRPSGSTQTEAMPDGKRKPGNKSLYKSYVGFDDEIIVEVEESNDYQKAIECAETIIDALSTENADGLVPDADEIYPVVIFGDDGSVESRKKAYMKGHQKLEDKFAKKVVGLFDSEVKKLTSAVKKNKPISKLEAIVDSFKTKARSEAEEVYNEIVEKAGDSAMAELKREVNKSKAAEAPNLEFDLYDPDVASFISERSYDFWENVSDTTKQNLKELLVTANDLGWTADETADALASRAFGDFTDGEYKRARLIARTETTIALGQATMLAYQQSGLSLSKRWLTAEDEKVRVTHTKCEEEGAIPLGQPFSNGLMFPGDPSTNNVAELANCRCHMVPVVLS